jgi:hypothetical protein
MRNVLSFRFCCVLLVIAAVPVQAQVSPAEIRNPELKALEQSYFQQLMELNRAVQSTKFPYHLFLSRYVGLDGQHAGADTRGIEFVEFHGEVVLKFSGDYAVSYNTDLLTQNQRASRTFEDVIVPLLTLATKVMQPTVTCDSIGFEISYHVRARTQNADYEGKEILVVVLGKGDAFGYANALSEESRQQILNRSGIYLNGQPFGLAFGATAPQDVETLDRSRVHKAEPTAAVAASESRPDGRSDPAPASLQPLSSRISAPLAAQQAPTHLQVAVPPPPSQQSGATTALAAAATPGDADRLEAKYQPQLDAFAKEKEGILNLLDYAPPSFVVFRSQVMLQVTMRNPTPFDRNTSSIYKRAAQSFDLFLAPRLKTLVDEAPEDAEIAGLDVTVLNDLGASPSPSSEALEFVLPLKPLRQFVNAEITNQDLINQSTVLVNSVRIALNLQLVE